MPIVLQFLKGPLKGKVVTIKRSISIGRAGTDVALNDPKLSQIHAFIQKTRDGLWVLKDNNSRNGILVRGKPVKSQTLLPGVEFQMGTSYVRCKSVGEIQEKPGATMELVVSFSKWLKRCAEDIPNNINLMQEIRPQIVLKFVRGMQTGTQWPLFYAPRTVGTKALDLCLFEDGLPENLFVIQSISGQPYLKTEHRHLVRINGENVDKRKLLHGDIIQFGDSKIEVEMVLE